MSVADCGSSTQEAPARTDEEHAVEEPDRAGGHDNGEEHAVEEHGGASTRGDGEDHTVKYHTVKYGARRRRRARSW